MSHMAPKNICADTTRSCMLHRMPAAAHSRLVADLIVLSGSSSSFHIAIPSIISITRRGAP